VMISTPNHLTTDLCRTKAIECLNLAQQAASNSHRIMLKHTGHHVFSASGDLVEVIGTHVDVTKRRRAEEALRESEARSRSALDGIAGLIAVLAPNGEIETVNRQFLEYFCQSLEWIKNWETNDAVHE
jgi:PAS domain-containing protein